MCVYALKETFDNYKRLNTPVCMCFLDSTIAFHQEGHGKIFQTLWIGEPHLTWCSLSWCSIRNKDFVMVEVLPILASSISRTA